MELFPRCRAEFNMPCSINWVYWMVRHVVDLLESGEASVEDTLANATAGAYDKDFGFWPDIIDLETGRFLASGAPLSVRKFAPGDSRIGNTVDDVFSAEAPTIQKGFWKYLLERGDARYVEYIGRDSYHASAQPRVLYWEIACNVSSSSKRYAVVSSYTNLEAGDLAQTCDSTSDELCSVTYAAQTTGTTVSRLLTAEDENQVRLVLYAVTSGAFNPRHNRDEGAAPCYGGQSVLDSGCFFPVVVDAETGKIVAHGNDRPGVGNGTRGATFIGRSVSEPPWDITSLEELRLPAEAGGTFRLMRHSATGLTKYLPNPTNVSNNFIMGLSVFNRTYYVYCPYLHRMGTVREGPYCTACSSTENHPCGWNNARVLLGHIQTMLLGTVVDDDHPFEDAWNEVTTNPEYAIDTLGTKDFYAFAYDWEDICVAHGRFPQFVGNALSVNAEFIADQVDLAALHLRWVEASTTDAKFAVRYPWLTSDGECCFDKVVYVIQIARNKRNYYVAVGIGETQPKLPTFSEAQNGYISSKYRSYDADLLAQSAVALGIFSFATAETHAMYLDAVGNVSAIAEPSRQNLKSQGFSEAALETWWDTSTNPFQLMVWAEIQSDLVDDHIIVYEPEPAYVGKTLDEVSALMGAEPLNFVSLSPGDWSSDLYQIRRTLDDDLESHFLYYDSIDVADEIFDGRLDGAGARLHLAVFVRDERAPPSGAHVDTGGCETINAYSSAALGVPGDQCVCDENTVQTWRTLSYEDDDDDKGLSCLEDRGEAKRVTQLYEMACVNLTSCPAGRYRSGNDVCVQCDAGKFRLSGSDASCRSCEPGRFATKPGSVQCTDCPANRYQDQSGMTTCSECPKNTARFVLPPKIQPLGTAITDCLCIPGSCDSYPCKYPYVIEQIFLDHGVPLPYNSSSAAADPRRDTGAYVTGFRETSGVECEECPNGGVCLGASNPPYPAVGFNGKKWGRVVGVGREARYTGVNRRTLQAEWRSRVKFYECEGEQEGDSHWCDGDFRCHERTRRKGRLMCWAIAKKYFSLFGKDYKCRGGKVVRYFMTIVLFAAAILVFLFLNVVMGSYPAMDIFLNNARNMSIIKDFNISWPLNKKYFFSLWYWFTLLDITQIDTEIVQPTCVAHESFETQVITQMSLFLVETVFYFGYAFLSMPRAANDEARQSLVSKAMSRVLSATTMMYPTLADVGLRGFICKTFDDNNSYLIADLNVRCWTSRTHARILVFCTSLTIFVVVYPVVIFLTLRHYHARNELHSKLCLERYGLLYEGFKLENYQWGVFQIAKAFTLSCIQVLLEPRVTMQIFTALMVLIFAVAAHFYHNPFLHRKSDHLEAFLLFATCAMIGMGSTFETLDAEDNNSRVEGVIFALLHFLLLSAVFASLRAVYVDVWERRLTTESRL